MIDSFALYHEYLLLFRWYLIISVVSGAVQGVLSFSSSPFFLSISPLFLFLHLAETGYDEIFGNVSRQFSFIAHGV